jgi:hypothetical protein
MLVIHRSKKIDALVKLFEAYCNNLTKSIGEIDIKDQALWYNSNSDIAYFNFLSLIGVSVNFLEVSSLLEKAKASKVPFIAMAHNSLIDIKQLLSQELSYKGNLHGLHFNLRYDLMQYDAHPAAKVIEVKTAEQYYEWVDIFSHAYDLNREQVEKAYNSALAEDSQLILHIMQVYQKTVACSLSVKDGEKVLLLWDTVLPMYRRQGLGSMMILQRLFDFQEQGVKDVFSLGFYSSYDLARSVGFKHLVTLPFYRYDPPIADEE